MALKQGWAALCFTNDEPCVAFIIRTAPLFRSIKSEFSVQSALMALPGTTSQITALIVPPDDEK